MKNRMNAFKNQNWTIGKIYKFTKSIYNFPNRTNAFGEFKFRYSYPEPLPKDKIEAVISYTFHYVLSKIQEK